MGTVSVRIEPMKTSKLSFQERHDKRIDTPSYADAEKSHLNKSLLPEKPFSDAVQEVEAEYKTRHGRGLRHDAARLMSGVITFGDGAADLVNSQPPDDYALQYLERFCEEHGVRPVELVRHGDEETVHYHFMTTNLNQKSGKLLSAEFAPDNVVAKRPDKNYKSMSVLQDIAGEVFAPIGLERGKKKVDRIKDGEDFKTTRHRSVSQLHRDLPNELLAMQEKLRLAKEEVFALKKAAQAIKHIKVKRSQVIELEYVESRKGFLKTPQLRSGKFVTDADHTREVDEVRKSFIVQRKELEEVADTLAPDQAKNERERKANEIEAARLASLAQEIMKTRAMIEKTDPDRAQKISRASSLDHGFGFER